jgi:hypothetical protein
MNISRNGSLIITWLAKPQNYHPRVQGYSQDHDIQHNLMYYFVDNHVVVLLII